MEKQILIFLLDDDPSVLQSLRSLIQDGMGYQAEAFLPDRMKDFLRRAVVDRPAMFILDHHLTDKLKGTDVLAQLRELEVRAPVIFLSGEKDPDLRVTSLNLTADDFVSKPFSPPELMARIKAVLRRSSNAEDTRIRGDARATDANFEFCGCEVAPRIMQATSLNGKKKVKLTPYLMAVAQMLHRYRGSVVTRREMFKVIWGAEIDEKSRVLDQTVYDLRTRLGRIDGDTLLIENVKGVGYLYAAPEAAGAKGSGKAVRGK